MDFYKTHRVTVEELEKTIEHGAINVLDHGFIRVVDYMGNDESIVQAARVSYGKGTKQVNQDKALINYLMKHYHTTPFEMCEIKLHIKAPIFVARQWLRHRTASVNEYSARYSILDKEFYVPSPENIGTQSEVNKQGRSSELSDEENAEILEIIKNDSLHCYNNYKKLLNLDEQGNVIDENRSGLARELARVNLTMNYYTQFYWKINLHNFMHFVRLRADKHAQYEIQQYAELMLDLLELWCPLTYEAFMNYRYNSYSMSQKDLDVIKRMIKGEKVSQECSGLSKREWDYLTNILDDNE